MEWQQTYAEKARECLELAQKLGDNGTQMRDLAVCWQRLLQWAKERDAKRDHAVNATTNRQR
jgi:hypothetical protein